MNKSFKLTYRDFIWIIIILIGCIIAILSVRLSDNDNVVNVISFISSGVSIALALVAIGISLKQGLSAELNSKDTKDEFYHMNEKVNSLMNNLICTQDIMSKGYKGLGENLTKTIEDKIRKSTDGKTEMSKELKETISDEIEKSKEETKSKLNEYYNPRISEQIKITDTSLNTNTKFNVEEFKKAFNFLATNGNTQTALLGIYMKTLVERIKELEKDSNN